MKLIASLLTGGFLKGYRTYLLGFALALTGLAQYLAGDLSLAGLLDKLPEILGGLGLASLRSGVQTILPALEAILGALARSPAAPEAGIAGSKGPGN
jgi:hypothetical protein